MAIKHWKSWVGGVLAVSSVAVAVHSSIAPQNEAARPDLAEERQPQQVSPPSIEEGLSFAEVVLPLERVGVRERMEKELLIGTFRHSSSLLTFRI